MTTAKSDVGEIDFWWWRRNENLVVVVFFGGGYAAGESTGGRGMTKFFCSREKLLPSPQ